MKAHPWKSTGTRTSVARDASEDGLVLPWDGVEERATDSRPDRTEEGYVSWSTDPRETSEDALPLALVRPVCARCHLELPASGVCGWC